MDEQVKKLMDELVDGVTGIFDSEKYKNYLRIMAKFPHYSFNNTLLIYLQRPAASHVAGYQTWKSKFGRQVKKGEKGIQILAPVTYKTKKKKTEEDGKTKDQEEPDPFYMLRGFRVVHVFDVSQTEGRELPSIVESLHGEVEQFPSFFSAVCKISPVPVSCEPMEDTADGYYSHTEKRICIREGMSESQTAAALIHELSHAMLHNQEMLEEELALTGIRKDRRTKEVEAESVAFVVNSYFGNRTDENSFGYIAGWSSGKEVPELLASLTTIQTTAEVIIQGMERAYEKELERKEEPRAMCR